MFKNYSYDSNLATNKHSFEIHNIDVSIVNGIRRTILTDIPIPGIIGEDSSTVEIIKNNGPLHNEILSHRIGLIPICLSEDDIENYENMSLVLELNVINTGHEMVNVTTGDIKGKRYDKELTPKELSIMFPKNPVSNSNILITRLRQNEQLHFKATVVVKKARYNSAFCPVSLSNFFYIQDPKVANEQENVLDKERSYYVNEYGEANAIQFEIESINPSLSPKYLFNKAIDIIINKIENLISNITSQNIGYNGVKVYQYNDIKNTYEFSIDHEDDTLGNIIQSLIHNKDVRNAKSKINEQHCSYIGYICPHPLKTELLIRITLENETNQKEFIKYLEYSCRDIIDMFSNIKTEWNKFAKH